MESCDRRIESFGHLVIWSLIRSIHCACVLTCCSQRTAENCAQLDGFAEYRVDISLWQIRHGDNDLQPIDRLVGFLVYDAQLRNELGAGSSGA